jgi:hypothetical protein
MFIFETTASAKTKFKALDRRMSFVFRVGVTILDMVSMAFEMLIIIYRYVLANIALFLLIGAF